MTATDLRGVDLDREIERVLGGDAIAIDFPTPWSRDVRLAMGLLGDENFNVHRHGNEITVILGDMAAIGKFRVEGTARLSEFPDATDDQRREYATAHAICRAVLAAKGGER